MSTENKDLYVFEDGLREVTTSLSKWSDLKKDENPDEDEKEKVSLRDQVGNDMKLSFPAGMLGALVEQSEASGLAIDLVVGDSAVPAVLTEKDSAGRAIIKPVSPLKPKETLKLAIAEDAAGQRVFGGERMVTVRDLAVAIGHGATLEVSPSKADDN